MAFFLISESLDDFALDLCRSRYTALKLETSGGLLIEGQLVRRQGATVFGIACSLSRVECCIALHFDCQQPP